MSDKVEISRDVADFLALVLSRQSVSAADPSFDETVSMVSKARKELLGALAPPTNVKSPVHAVGKGRAKANNTSRRQPEQH